MNPSSVPESTQSFHDLAQKITWIISDVDGVMTDGGIIYDQTGNQLKKFHVRDGLGVRLWQRAGHHFGILTARQSKAVERRGAELKVDYLSQGNEDKWVEAKQFFDQQGVDLQQVCYIGDDLTDLPVLEQVGLSVCVADAAEELIQACDTITDRPGGYGAVREVVEKILQAQGQWDAVVEAYRLNPNPL